MNKGGPRHKELFSRKHNAKVGRPYSRLWDTKGQELRLNQICVISETELDENKMFMDGKK